METNPNIIRLLEMLESPEAYSEQEIRDIINKDEETREAYRLMDQSGRDMPTRPRNQQTRRLHGRSFRRDIVLSLQGAAG